MSNPVEKLIKIVGTQAELAKKCNVKQQSVYKWLKKGKVPADRVPLAVAASGGKMTPDELCPTAKAIMKVFSQFKTLN
jgi:DNA-binding transcriptional regulator YdaS (Cro superfamily)